MTNYYSSPIKTLISGLTTYANYVITQWDEHGQPPVIGQNKDEIINKWTKLSTFNVNDFFTVWFEGNR